MIVGSCRLCRRQAATSADEMLLARGDVRMRVCIRAAITLACIFGSIVAPQPADAQFGSIPISLGQRSRAPAYVAQAPAQARSVPTPDPAMQTPAGTPQAGYYNPEEIPAMQGHTVDGQYIEGHDMGGYYADGYNNGACDSTYGTDTGCCETCGNYGGGCGCCCPPGWSLLGNSGGGNFFVTAEYLYVRASFSEAISYLDQDDTVPLVGRDDFHQLDFDYESSYRIGGGYRLCGCNDEIRFMFTRLGSSASDIAPDGTFVPYEASPPPGGQTFVTGDVNVKTFDVAFAKQFPLGGSCGCGDACGCGDSCGCGSSCGGGGCCPKWAVTWSGGFRFADVNWNRSFFAVDENETLFTNANAALEFQGGGLRMGLEGRRYLWNALSIYLKGDLSLLMGDLELNSDRIVDNGSVPDLQNFQTISGRQIIPVTELEAGLTGQVTWNTSLSAGYLFSAWHDLGFRDQFGFQTFMETSYDDANILGFDGFFARLEVQF
jgi:hypothetical protein